MKVSVVISTRNRQDSLGRTIRSVKGLADEIIVIDNQSTDNTAGVAKGLGAKVFTRPNNLMLNVNKNYGFSKATGDWILCLDDDEVVPPELAQEIKEVLGNTEVSGFWIPRKNIIFGKWIQHGIWWPDRQLRLFKRGAGKFPEKHVHEYVSVTGPTEVLRVAYIHYNYDSFSQFLEKMHVIYTESEVQKHLSAGYRVDWRDAIRFPLSDFIKLYFAQSGYKDGLHGLVLAILQAFYSFVIFVKLWEREKFREVDVPFGSVAHELTKSKQELAYWTHTVTSREVKNPFLKAWHLVLRKFTRVS